MADAVSHDQNFKNLFLGFDYLACALGDLPAERWMDSDNLVSCHACSVASEFALRVNARRGPQGPPQPRVARTCHPNDAHCRVRGPCHRLGAQHA